jgi:pSer/pThr/pTyr-binding forkhead associated (FHA) protein
MAILTLRVIDGCDRGRSYEGLTVPITIGREEGNAVQLNDERISRFHVKIQEEEDQLIITDLESTNGTKVNGQHIHLRILRRGDMIGIGRSLLIYGTRDEIDAQLRQQLAASENADGTLLAEDQALLGLEFDWENASPDAPVHSMTPPELPAGMSPSQAARLAELLDYLHLRMRGLIHSVSETGDDEKLTVNLQQWHNLVDLESRVAEYIRKIGEPG